LCLPTAPGLPLWRNGDFGTSPLLLGSSRTSRCLPVSVHVGCRNALHNGGSRHYALIRFDDGVVRWGKSRIIAQIRTEGSKSGHYTGGHHQTNRAMPEPITASAGGGENAQENTPPVCRSRSGIILVRLIRESALPRLRAGLFVASCVAVREHGARIEELVVESSICARASSNVIWQNSDLQRAGIIVLANSSACARPRDVTGSRGIGERRVGRLRSEPGGRAPIAVAIALEQCSASPSKLKFNAGAPRGKRRGAFGLRPTAPVAHT
jgi:hypothetical protein